MREPRGQATPHLGQLVARPQTLQKDIPGAMGEAQPGHLSGAGAFGGSPSRCPLPPQPGHTWEPDGPGMTPSPRQAEHFSVPRHLGQAPVPPQKGHGLSEPPLPLPLQAEQRPPTHWE